MFEGYVKLFRKVVNWEWYKDATVSRLFFHCLLKANHKENKWCGHIVEAGSFITSYEKIAQELGLSIQQVRTALNKLKSTHEITYKSTRQYSIITVNNWIDYQPNNIQDNKQITNNQQTINKQSTTNKNDKNDKNVEVVEENLTPAAVSPIEVIHSEQTTEEYLAGTENWYGEFANVHLTKQQYMKLLGITMSEKGLNMAITQLSEKIAAKKAEPFDEKFPDMHYVAVNAFWKYIKENPKKFIQKTTEEQPYNGFA